MSAVPTPYTRQFDFTDFSTESPNAQQPGVSIDAELDAVKTLFDAMQARAAEIQRDDGQLKNGIVTMDSLDADVLLGLETPTIWAISTAYTLRSTVTYLGNLYLCTTAHTSSGTFDVTKWRLLLTIPTVAAAEAAIAAAEAASIADIETAAEAAVEAAIAALSASGLSQGFDRWNLTTLGNVYSIPGATVTDPESYLVLVGGICVTPSQYTIDIGAGQIDLTAFFSSHLIATGLEMKVVCLQYPRQSDSLADGAVTRVKLGADVFPLGSILQTTEARDSNISNSGASNIPTGSTPAGSGVLLVQANITPLYATSRIRVRAVINAFCASAYQLVCAGYVAGTANAQHVGSVSGAAGDTLQCVLEFYHSPGVTTSLTYSIRGGAVSAADDVIFNTTDFGAKMANTLVLEEIKTA